MTRGLVIGKFYPPHAGHHYLIEHAEAGCDELMVMCLWSVTEGIYTDSRLAWLRESHPNSLIVEARDENPIDYSDEGWQKHIDIIGDTVMQWGHKPDVVFTSEQYGDEFAMRLADHIGHNVHHELVDLNRGHVDISGTDMRADMAGNWDFLSPAAKAGLAFRVVICGGESTGTTTLAKDLAEHYDTACVPEYGRHFDWAVGKHHTWATEDFTHIAKTQTEWIDRFGRYTKNGILIADTDAYATAMFHEVYLGFQEYDILDYAMQHAADLYFITDHDGVKFVDDGTRMNSGKRPWMTKWFDEFLPDPHILVSGTRKSRLKVAISEIDARIKAHHKYAEPVGEVTNA